MPFFHFKARDAEGKIIEGARNAADKYEFAKELRAEGMTVLSIVPEHRASFKNANDIIPDFLRTISLEEKMNFARTIAVMIGSGVSLTRSLESVERQSQNKKFKTIIQLMVDALKRGQPFAETLAQHSKIFPHFFIEMVRAGEKSGKLENSLELVATQLKKDYILRKKVKSALVYPAIVVITMIGIAILMLLYVVPALTQTFNELGIVLPTSTQVIIALSNFITNHGAVFALMVAGFLYAVWYIARTSVGRRALDLFFIHAPVIKTINQNFNAARMCRTFSSLLFSGVAVSEALHITANVLQNRFYKNILLSAEEYITRGEALSVPFRVTPYVFPALVGEMMVVGEETGKVPQMLEQLAVFYENEVAVATKDLSTIIEPVLMVIIGIVVGFFAISMISPMYNLVGGF